LLKQSISVSQLEAFTDRLRGNVDGLPTVPESL